MKRTIQLSWIAILFLLALWLTSFVFSESVFACECRRRNDFRHEFESSKAVFAGEVIAVDDSQPGAVITFKVERMWKGLRAARIEVRTDNRGKACGYRFRQGERYLVYAYDDGDLRTSICTRTSAAKMAAGDLKKLAKRKSYE